MNFWKLSGILINLVGLFLMSEFVSGDADYECGWSHNQKFCTGAYTGQCCSNGGYCGLTDAYCGQYCESRFGPCSRYVYDNNCGITNLFKNCTGEYTGQCCSAAGRCGTSITFCGTGCQANYGPCT